MFLLKMLFPTACLAKMLAFWDSQSLHFELCCGISWTYVPQLKLFMVWDCAEGTGRAHDRACSRWRGGNVSGLVQEPHPGRCWTAPCVLSALSCRFSLACVYSATHSVLTVLAHRWPCFSYYTLGWRPCSSAKQQWNYQNRPVSDSSWHWRASVPLREEQG